MTNCIARITPGCFHLDSIHDVIFRVTFALPDFWKKREQLAALPPPPSSIMADMNEPLSHQPLWNEPRSFSKLFSSLQHIHEIFTHTPHFDPFN